jgi:hypothetical protein
MKTVEISLERLAELLKSEARLIALECGGVDNWDWYSESLDSADEEIEKIDARLEDGTLTP